MLFYEVFTNKQKNRKIFQEKTLLINRNSKHPTNFSAVALLEDIKTFNHPNFALPKSKGLRRDFKNINFSEKGFTDVI